MEENSRLRTRVNFKTRVTLEAGDHRLEDLDSRDLSLKGVYVETDHKLEQDARVDVTLDLAGASSELKLHMKGRVARVDAKGLGISFEEIDLDSFAHLRNIILYNAGDPSDVDHELASKPAF